MKFSPEKEHKNQKLEGNRDNCDYQGKMCSLRREVNKEGDQLQRRLKEKNTKISMEG